jgi:hypothetical protein
MPVRRLTEADLCYIVDLVDHYTLLESPMGRFFGRLIAGPCAPRTLSCLGVARALRPALRAIEVDITAHSSNSSSCGIGGRSSNGRCE